LAKRRKKLSVEHIVGLRVLTQMRDSLREALGITVDIWGNKGDTIFTLHDKEFSHFCSLIRCSKATTSCKLSDDRLLKLAFEASTGIRMKCKHGLWDFAAPILLADQLEPIGTILAGQVRDESSINGIDFHHISSKTGVDESELRNAYKELPTYGEELLDFIPKMLNAFAKNLGKLVEHKLGVQYLLDRTASTVQTFFNKEQVFRAMLEGAVVSSGADAGAVYAAKWTEHILTPVSFSGKLWSKKKYAGARSLEYGFDEGILGRIFRTGKPEVIKDVQTDPDYITLLDEVKSEMVFPIVYGGVTKGVLLLAGFEANMFDEATLRETQSVEKLAAATLAFTTLAEYLAELNTTSTLAGKEILDRILPVVANLLGFPMCSVWLINDDDPETLYLENSFGYRTLLSKYTKMPLDKSISGCSLLQNKIIVVTSISDSPDEYFLKQRAKEEDIESLISIPLVSGDKTKIGVLNLEDNKSRSLSSTERELLNAMGMQLANILYQRKIMKRLESIHQELVNSGRVALAGALTLKIIHRIKASLKALQKGLLTISKSKHVKGTSLKEVASGCEREMSTLFQAVEETLPLVREVRFGKWELLDMSALVKSMQAKLYLIAMAQNAKIEVDIPDEVIKGYMDETAMRDILACLVSNSLEAHARRVILRLRMRCETINNIEQEYTIIEVDDNGIGLSGNLFETSFEPGVTTKSRGKGTGLGLYISRQFARLAGGDVKFKRSIPNRSTIVSIYLRQ
jgi:signal transduction histidine kinase/ligand-binding sensor protein